MAKVFGEDARSFSAKLDKVIESTEYKETIGKWLSQLQEQAVSSFVDEGETNRIFWYQGRASVPVGLKEFIKYAREAATNATRKELAKEEANRRLKEGI